LEWLAKCALGYYGSSPAAGLLVIAEDQPIIISHVLQHTVLIPFEKALTNRGSRMHDT